MSMTVKEFKTWLNCLEDDQEIAVDDGGLAIVLVGDEDTYCEIGGVPLEDEAEVSS